ncbi:MULTISPECIES: HAD family phosphatase [Gardnerella]|uniref:HAD family hydrolase n=1 Tax=Gardnerella vaginalis TaxID=2702 RepID=A0AAP8ISB0_GARVA|nr:MULTISPECIES: HAD family hydrolase [Gardnerella]MDK7084314.1 HAD family hydrolase [Gardnerella leopoldii]PKZ59329.1 HAD family hydrolase [Gardnerella vaginalis]
MAEQTTNMCANTLNSSEEKHVLRAVFWDMDGTLIDSEPYWHESEFYLVKKYGGYWDEDLAWECSGGSLETVANKMIPSGTKLTVEEIGKGMVDYVAAREAESVPWVPGVLDVLKSLTDAGITSILVSNSPRCLVENIVNHAPEGAFAGYVCGDDGFKPKPSAEPYLAAGKMVGIEGTDEEVAKQMANCIAIEDSLSGLTAAVNSGATVIAQTGFSRANISESKHHAELNGYENVTAKMLENIVLSRN